MLKNFARVAVAALLSLAIAVPAFAAGASIWPNSRVPFIDIDGDPMVGATVEFFNCETSTPQVVYEDFDLSTPHSQPIEADARGMFSTIYFSAAPGCYRVRVEDADGALIFDDDGIAVAQTADFLPPDAGETSEELLFRTGMIEPWYGTTAPSGWVRCNGRTIGNEASGATERANADTEDLFEHLWTVDATLSVSSGRGGSASGDYAANKTIELPSCRDRSLAGLSTMGNSDVGLVADTYVDGGEDTSDLGATAGVDDVVLTEAQMPTHNHTASFTGTPLGAHSHTFTTADDTNGGGGGTGSDNDRNPERNKSTTSDSAGTPAGTVTVNNAGSSAAHNNMPPTLYVTFLIKL